MKMVTHVPDRERAGEEVQRGLSLNYEPWFKDGVYLHAATLSNLAW